MVRPSLPYAALACVAMFVNGCAIHSAPPTVTVWNKLGIPQSFDAANANWINKHGNHPKWEKKPPLKRIADPLNLQSPNPAIKAAAEIKAEEDLAPQKIKALKYLATIGCGCYDKEGKVEAAILAGLNDCTEEVRKTAVQTVATAAGSCACNDGCSSTCCTEKIQEKLQDMAYGETDGCWHEPSAEVRSMAAQALAACPPISVLPATQDSRETVPTPAIPGRETAPGMGEPLPPIPPPAPLQTTAPANLQDAAIVPMPEAPVEKAPQASFYAPVHVGFAEKQEAFSQSQVATVSAEMATESPAMMVIQDNEPLSISVASQPEIISTKVEFVQQQQSAAVMHLPKATSMKVGQTLAIQIHSRRGEHTIDGKVQVVNVDGSLLYVRPIDGLALNVLRPGSSISIAR
ncbi:hypothetical protein [Bremerella cremea]|uniref:hypothetical protein n=1 Tax=Bremerella cremea TaxID=1031537 RepID=UPI0031F03367